MSERCRECELEEGHLGDCLVPYRERIRTLEAEVERLRITCDAHIVVIGDKEAEIALLRETGIKEDWHKGFCTPSCTPGHHASGCYEQMISAAQARVRELEAQIKHWEDIGLLDT